MKVLMLFFLLMLSTCGGSGSSTESGATPTSEIAYDAPMTRLVDQQNYETIEVSNRKMIWTGNVEVQVKNVDEATVGINNLCKKYNAFVSTMNLNNTSYEISNDITIRVSSEHFASLMEDIKAQGDFLKNVSISSNDVTEQYIDVTSRLKTKKEVRERYIEILKNKTGRISEVLEAEEAIRKITEEIEAKEGQLRYLEDKIKYSTINVRLYEKITFREEPDIYEKSFGDKVIQALKNGWNIVTTLVIVAINIWPLILIGGFLIWRWKWVRGKLSGKKRTGNP